MVSLTPSSGGSLAAVREEEDRKERRSPRPSAIPDPTVDAPSSSKMYLRSLQYQLERKRAAKKQEVVSVAASSISAGHSPSSRIHSKLERSYALQRENANAVAAALATASSADERKQKNKVEKKFLRLSQTVEPQYTSRGQTRNEESRSTPAFADRSQKATSQKHHIRIMSSPVIIDKFPTTNSVAPKAKENARPAATDCMAPPLLATPKAAKESSSRGNVLPLFTVSPFVLSLRSAAPAATKRHPKDPFETSKRIPPPIPLKRSRSSSPSPRADVSAGDIRKNRIMSLPRSRSASSSPLARDLDSQILMPLPEAVRKHQPRRSGQKLECSKQRAVGIDDAEGGDRDPGEHRSYRFSQTQETRLDSGLSVRTIHQEKSSSSARTRNQNLPPLSPNVGPSCSRRLNVVSSPRHLATASGAVPRTITEPQDSSHTPRKQSSSSPSVSSSAPRTLPASSVLSSAVMSLGAVLTAQCLMPAAMLLEDGQSCEDYLKTPKGVLQISRSQRSRGYYTRAEGFDSPFHGMDASGKAPSQFYMPKSCSPFPSATGPTKIRSTSATNDLSSPCANEDVVATAEQRGSLVSTWPSSSSLSSSSSAWDYPPPTTAVASVTTGAVSTAIPFSHEMSRASRTHEELLRLKHELDLKKSKAEEGRQRRGMVQDQEDRRQDEEQDEVEDAEYTKGGLLEHRTYLERKRLEWIKLHGKEGFDVEKKRVRFSRPLVTLVRHRPYTLAEDIDKLYFGEEELDELVSDRAAVEGDQFELSLVREEKDQGLLHTDDGPGAARGGEGPFTNSDAYGQAVAVTYTNKRLLRDQVHRLEEGGDEVPFSPSDDLSSVFYE